MTLIHQPTMVDLLPRTETPEGAEVVVYQGGHVMLMATEAIMKLRPDVEDVTGSPFIPTAEMNATVQTVTNSTNVSVVLPKTMAPGFSLGLMQGGAGQLDFTPEAGATVRQVDGATKTRKQYAYVTAFVSSNPNGQSAVWHLIGDMEVV